MAFVFGLAALAMVGWATGKYVRGKNAVNSLEDQMHQTFSIYTSGSFSDATNALLHYTAFLENHRAALSKDYEVDSLLYAAYGKLGYMFLYSGDEILASQYFTQAFGCSRRSGTRKIEPTEFVDFFVAGTSRIDAQTGVAWKASRDSPTNMVDKVKVLFGIGISNELNEPSGESLKWMPRKSEP